MSNAACACSPAPGRIMVDGILREGPPGLVVRSCFTDKNVARFAGRARSAASVSEVIIHESVTRSVSSTVSVLKRRGLGVHLIVGPDGVVTQHGDLAVARLAHAGGHNGPSVGLEVVNPYYPRLRRAGSPWSRVIEAPWAHHGKYLLPTPAQAEAVASLVGWLACPIASGLMVPRNWVGVAKDKFRLGRVRGATDRAPGIYAHHHFAHADGAWPALYAWLRLEAGLPPGAAYDEAAGLVTGARGTADISGLVTGDQHKREQQ